MLNRIIQKIENITSINPYTKVYGLSRTLIAVATLSVFLFNDFSILFDKDSLNVISSSGFLFNKVNLFGIIGYENIFLSKIIGILILLWVISGYFPQISGLLHFWITYSFHSSCTLLDGGDQIATILTFIILPLTIFDRRINHWNTKIKQSQTSRLIGHLTYKVISLQIAFIYFHTAVEKLYKLSEWKDGTALYYIFKSNYFGLSDFFLSLFEPVINSKLVFFATWCVILSHLFLSYLLFLPRENKKKYIIFGIIFHSSIALFMGLYSFSIVMCAALILYIIPFNNNLKLCKKEFILKKDKFFT